MVMVMKGMERIFDGKSEGFMAGMELEMGGLVDGWLGFDLIMWFLTFYNGFNCLIYCGDTFQETKIGFDGVNEVGLKLSKRNYPQYLCEMSSSYVYFNFLF